jgi:hypothetical protein
LGAGNTNQQWQINLLSNGKYNFINLSSGMARDNSGTTTNNAPVAQNVPSSSSLSQQWEIRSLGSVYCQIASASSSMALDNGKTEMTCPKQPEALIRHGIPRRDFGAESHRQLH